MQGEKAPAAKTVADDSGAPPVTPEPAEHPTSATPVLGLFSEQKT
jgi:hypothetical protein